MPNKKYFISCVLIMVVSISLTLYFAIVDSIALSNITIVIFIIGTIMMIHWNTISYKWICDKCGNTRILTMWQNFKGMNIGMNEKFIHCEKCGKKVKFKGIKRLS